MSKRLDKAREEAGIRVGDLDPNFELAFNQFQNRSRNIDPILIRAVLLDLMTNLLDGYRKYIHFDVVSNAERNREPISHFEDMFDKEGFVNSKRRFHPIPQILRVSLYLTSLEYKYRYDTRKSDAAKNCRDTKLC